MRVSQLAKFLNIAPDTVRYYTRNGLISATKSAENGYKFYNEEARNRLQFILSARHLGFSVKDIKSILSQADKGHSSCPLVRDLIEKRLQATEQKFQQMLALRSRMLSAVDVWQEKPDKAPSSQMICHLIEGFAASTRGE